VGFAMTKAAAQLALLSTASLWHGGWYGQSCLAAPSVGALYSARRHRLQRRVVGTDAFRHLGRMGGEVLADGGHGVGLLWRLPAPGLKISTSLLRLIPPHWIWNSRALCRRSPSWMCASGWEWSPGEIPWPVKASTSAAPVWCCFPLCGDIEVIPSHHPSHVALPR
jgi:hypothetical protein